MIENKEDVIDKHTNHNIQKQTKHTGGTVIHQMSNGVCYNIADLSVSAMYRPIAAGTHIQCTSIGSFSPVSGPAGPPPSLVVDP